MEEQQKLIDSGISINHVKEWTAEEAIREVVQNYIDVLNEFKVTGTIKYNPEGFAVIKDSGPGLQMKHLAFGNNEKVAGSIGQFGEGLKSAIVTLTRLGRNVQIRTCGKIITPLMRMSNDFQVTTLHYQIASMTPRLAARFKGTEITVSCSRQELQIAQRYFTYFAQKELNFKWLDKGSISLPGGFIYVNGSKVANLKTARFSYHFSGAQAARAINRDRNSVNMEVVSDLISEAVAFTSSHEVMRDMIIGNVYSPNATWENNYLSIYNIPSNKVKVWKRVWNSHFSDKDILPTNSEHDTQATYLGFRLLPQIGPRQKVLLETIGVKSSRNAHGLNRKHLHQSKVVKLSDLTVDERANLKFARQMVKKYYSTKPYKLVIEKLDMTTNGYCEHSSTNKIALNKSILWDKLQTLHTLLHEMVHLESGENDCTAGFEDALLRVAVGIIKRKELK